MLISNIKWKDLKSEDVDDRDSKDIYAAIWGYAKTDRFGISDVDYVLINNSNKVIKFENIRKSENEINNEVAIKLADYHD